MSSKHIAWITMLGLGLAGFAVQATYWDSLPDRMATHFGVDGKPNDWMPKWNALWLLGTLQIGLPLLFVAIGELIPRFPNSMINIPNREHWLDPERRESSLAYVKAMLAWLGVLVTGEMLAVTYITIIANVHGTPLPMSWFFGILATFMIGTLTVVVHTLRRFS